MEVPSVLPLPKPEKYNFAFDFKVPSRTVSAHPNNFGEKPDAIKILDALNRAGLSNSIETLQIFSGKVEILCDSPATKAKLLTMGLKVGNTHVSFRDLAVRFFPVTVCGLPPEVTNEEFGIFMGRFGTISKHYHVYKQAGNKRIKNGNRVFQFSKLTTVPPTSHLVQGRIVRIVYSKNIHQDFCSEELWKK